ncbi:uncharacterized protein GGS22DRAFT_199172 [Annulohypoxylon maeteangense]|uniref:uncharacterized protein n=1 Tax=Annulohypoxylon maeteangense TaxID=1927788 RepID=UPI0020075D3E|nr:uncharacterized protein GGS22DRAFT_199172 [Annulohypoxylon maeteangense]KAI0886833.1 hypothetical protein GGS22DRAFT_199172 [Annulohypoxylon maeteangense]
MLPVVSFIGFLASGKGSLGSKLADQFSLYHLVVPDLLNSLSNSRNNGQKTVKKYIHDYVLGGGNIPADLCTELKPFMNQTVETVMDDFYSRGEAIPLGILLPALHKKIELVSEEGKHRAILLDGFPRQLSDLKAAQHVFGKTLPDLTIWIDCPEEVARSRYSRRHRDRFEKQVAYFKEHIPLLLPELERTGLVRSESDDSMTVEKAYIRLLTRLYDNRTWFNIVSS